MSIYAKGLTKQWKKVGKHTWINNKPCEPNYGTKQRGMSDFCALTKERHDFFTRKAYKLQKGNKPIMRGPGTYRSI